LSTTKPTCQARAWTWAAAVGSQRLTTSDVYLTLVYSFCYGCVSHSVILPTCLRIVLQTLQLSFYHSPRWSTFHIHTSCLKLQMCYKISSTYPFKFS
jgi:hypothetical protein